MARELDYWNAVKRLFQSEYTSVTSEMSLSERFSAIRKNYQVFQSEVDDGVGDWMVGDDPYAIANWVLLFTPIEAAAWHDIRCNNLPLWPQLPVGRFFVDFGNPVVKVALECDGKNFHDPAKDAIRDCQLKEKGWVIYRVPGWRCSRAIEAPAEMRARGEDPSREYIEHYKSQTMAGMIEKLKVHF